MIQDTRKNWYWAGGVTAAIIALLFAHWLAGLIGGSAAVG